MAVFAFKDFRVRQENSPLKVSTDAILLGASVQLPSTTLKVLDVGTGSGVIALLLASRHENAQITGIDPDLGAFTDAQFNFLQSKFAQQLNAVQTALEDLPKDNTYDAIVSNPPYFLDSFAAQEATTQVAKHCSRQVYFNLLQDMCLRCNDAGQIWLVLPPKLAQETQLYLQSMGWKCTQEIHFHANPRKLDKRWVVCFEKNIRKSTKADYFIRDLEGRYHADYLQLAGVFHDRKL
jgi:tRNA1Val (adenine37-N6)-methyltransferase